jgi:hypothetical protein
MGAARLASRTIGASIGAWIGSLALLDDGRAQGGIACLPMTARPSYSFEKVIDYAEANATSVLPNDRGHALLMATPAGFSTGLCLLHHRGARTEPIACTRNIDPASPFTGFGGADWNERGTIVTGGSLHASFPGAGSSQIQVIEPNGAVFALSTFDFNAPAGKTAPAISGAGDVFYLDSLGNVYRYDPALPGLDKSALVLAATAPPITGLEPTGTTDLFFNAHPDRVGRIQGATGPSPQLTSVTVPDAAFGVPTPTRFGAFLYYSATEIRRRVGVGSGGFGSGDPEFVIELSGTPGSEDAPIVTSSGTLAGPCKVALQGWARGLCTGGPSDGLVCDPDAFPDPCPNGPGGEVDGYCADDVQGVFVHQAGTFAAVARPGDEMLGSVVQDFFSAAGPDVFRGSNAGHVFFGVRLADGRDVLVRADPAEASAGSPALPTSCTGVSCRFGLQPQGWLGVTPGGVPLYFDPDVATGYDYTLDPGDPRFASVMVPEPLPNGDAHFTLHVGEQSFPLAAGEQFDLTQVDPLGVEAFSIRGIDPGEELDPEDPMAFVTGATFVEERAANVTMTAVVPEPGATALGAAALAALALRARGARGRAAAALG